MPILGTIASSRLTTPPSTGAYYSLASYTVPSDTSGVVTFSSIDQSYDDLVLIISAGSTYGGSGGGTGGKMQFNGNTNAIHSFNGLYGNGNTGTGSVQSYNSVGLTYLEYGLLWSGNVNDWGMAIWTISDYSKTNKFKSFNARVGATLLVSGNGGNSNTQLLGGIFASNDAISSISFQATTPFSDGAMRAETTFTLFGVVG
jgi:hypothetical protein